MADSVSSGITADGSQPLSKEQMADSVSAFRRMADSVSASQQMADSVSADFRLAASKEAVSREIERGEEQETKLSIYEKKRTREKK